MSHNTFVKLNEAANCIEGISADSVVSASTKITEGMDIIKSRQKLIKLADESKAVRKAAEEYNTNPIADDSDNEKKNKTARYRAERK